MSLYDDIKHMSLGDKAFGACIILVALIEAWNGALAESTDLRATMPERFLAGVWPFLPLAILFVAAIIWLVKELKRPHHAPASSRPLSLIEKTFPTTDWDAPLTQKFRKSFVNETVLIDGVEFIECTFENVTIYFQGTRPARFVNSSMKANSEGKVHVRMASDNPIVSQYMHMVNELGLFGEKAEWEMETRPRTDVKIR